MKEWSTRRVLQQTAMTPVDVPSSGPETVNIKVVHRQCHANA